MSKLKGKSPELIKPGKLKAVMYGRSGVGKTFLSLKFPTPFFFDTEGGATEREYAAELLKSGGVYMGPGDGTLSFDTLIEQIQALATEKHPYRTLVVDSMTKLFQTAVANEYERMVKAGRDMNNDFGASKKPAISYMRRVIAWLDKLDMNVWLICHETSRWEKINGERMETGKTADCWEKLVYELNLCVQAVKRGSQRYAIVDKTRLSAFPEGETFKLEYDEFAARRGKETVEGNVGTITLALPDQINEIKKLLEIVKVPESDIQKGFDKVGVSDWTEMTSDQIAVWQKYLKGRLQA